MTSVATNSTLDLHSRLLVHRKTTRALKGSMTLFGTGGTILLFLESSVQQGQFSELLLLVHIRLIVNDHKHLFNHIGSGVDCLLVLSGNNDMQGLIVSVHDLSVPSSTRSFLDRAASTNSNFAPSLGFQFLLSFSTRSNNETNKVVIGMRFNRDANLFGPFAHKEVALTCGGIEIHEFLQDILAFGRVAFLPADRTGILALAVRSVFCVCLLRKEV